MKTNIEKAIEKIEENGIEEIVKLAVDGYTEGYNSIIFYDPDGNTYESETWTSETYLNPESRLVEVYRIDGNWIGNKSWEINDILTDEEYEELKKAVAKKENLADEYDIEYTTDFLNADQLLLINISLKDRLFDYCMYFDGLKDEIIEEIQRD